MTIGEQFRQAREAQRYTIRDVNQATSISIGHLSQLESGSRDCRKMGAKALWEACVFLGLCPCDVLRTAYGEEASE